MKNRLLHCMLFCFALLSAPFCVAEEGVPTTIPDPRGENFRIPSLDNQSPEQRLGRKSAEVPNILEGVEISEVTLERLPTYIQKQAEMAANECTKEKADVQLLKAYRYSNKYLNQKNLPDNYLLDFSAWKSFGNKTCHLGRICEKENCALVGYTAIEDERWSPQQPILAHTWMFVAADKKLLSSNDVIGKTDIPSYSDKPYFLTGTVGLPCTSQITQLQDKSALCITAYKWDQNSFVVLQPPLSAIPD